MCLNKRKITLALIFAKGSCNVNATWAKDLNNLHLNLEYFRFRQEHYTIDIIAILNSF